MFPKEETTKYEHQLKRITHEISEKEVTETLNFLYTLAGTAYDYVTTSTNSKQLNINYNEKTKAGKRNGIC